MRNTITTAIMGALLVLSATAASANQDMPTETYTNDGDETVTVVVRVQDGAMQPVDLEPGDSVEFEDTGERNEYDDSAPWAVYLGDEGGEVLASGAFTDPVAEPAPTEVSQPKRDILDVSADTFNDWRRTYPMAYLEWLAGNFDG